MIDWFYERISAVIDLDCGVRKESGQLKNWISGFILI